MTIYPDASFLVSWLYKPDPLNVKARVWFAQHQTDDFLISDWARFETINTLRDLCLRTRPPKQELVEGLRRYFSHLLQVGPFEFVAVDWDEVLKDAHQISAGFAVRLKARSAWTTNASVVVEATTSLTNPVWSTVITNAFTDGVFYFNDPQWKEQPSRFYRVRLP